MSTETIIGIKQLYEVEEGNEYMGKNKPVNLHLPIVSVCVATYQHADYIKNCIDGILMQKVNLNYEIIIGKDGSQDGTREICMDYEKKYSDKRRLYLRSLLTVLLRLTINRAEFVYLIKSLIPLQIKSFLHMESGLAIIG